jgi:hypothetical protein
MLLFAEDTACELVVRVTEAEVRELARGHVPPLVLQAITETAQEAVEDMDPDLPLFTDIHGGISV